MIMQIAIGAIAVVLVLGTMVWLNKNGYFEPENTNPDSPEERDELAQHRESFRIPLRKRAGAWSGPYKVFVAALVMLAVVMISTGYYVLKTGSPVQTYLPTWSYAVVVGVFGVGAGIRYKSWVDDQIGYLTVLYERSNGEPKAEEIPYAKNRVGTAQGGNPKLPEIAGRLLGVFPRYRLIGEHRELRGSQKPLDDVVEHLVPDHGVETNNGFIVMTREDGQITLPGATAVADLTYGSTNSLSDERAQEIRAEKKQLEAKNQTLKALNSELNSSLDTMQKALKNQEYQERQDLIEDFEQFSKMYSTLSVQIEENPSKNGASSGKENGDRPEAGA